MADYSKSEVSLDLMQLIQDMKEMSGAMKKLKERGDNTTFKFGDGSKYSVTRLN